MSGSRLVAAWIALAAIVLACAPSSSVVISISTDPAGFGQGQAPAYQLIDREGREVARGAIVGALTVTAKPGEYQLTVFVRGTSDLPTFGPGTYVFNPHAPATITGSCKTGFTAASSVTIVVRVGDGSCVIGGAAEP